MYDTTGLTTRFKVNRPLMDEEIEQQVKQSEAKWPVPEHHNRIIRMNSTFLECCDKYFYMKGSSSAWCIVTVLILIFFMGLFAYGAINKFIKGSEAAFDVFLAVIFAEFVLMLLIGAFIWGITRECFTYTYYPIRFNRKNRKVYVFRHNGTVLTADWDKLFFAPNKYYPTSLSSSRDLRGHVLAEDGKTVLETFALPYTPKSVGDLYPFWEWIREYMEKPNAPAELAPRLDEVLDITDKKQGYIESFEMICRAHLEQVSASVVKKLYIFTAFEAAGRWFAQITNKFPQWPKEIEDQCVIEPDDPYVVDAKTLKKRNEDKKS